jgi:hypothetical protein
VGKTSIRGPNSANGRVCGLRWAGIAGSAQFAPERREDALAMAAARQSSPSPHLRLRALDDGRTHYGGGGVRRRLAMAHGSQPPPTAARNSPPEIERRRAGGGGSQPSARDREEARWHDADGAAGSADQVTRRSQHYCQYVQLYSFPIFCLHA